MVVETLWQPNVIYNQFSLHHAALTYMTVVLKTSAANMAFKNGYKGQSIAESACSRCAFFARLRGNFQGDFPQLSKTFNSKASKCNDPIALDFPILQKRSRIGA